MEKSSSRILVADSFEPWRSYVRSTVEKCECLQIVGEAIDGLEAVQEAAKLKPDLVLLSVGLPKLNGIDAAKAIRKAIPGVKLLFVTQIIDEGVMKAALSNGARGYISKMNAQSELLPAIKAILRGETFVGSGMKG